MALLLDDFTAATDLRHASKTVIAELLKVGPKGYIHGWIFVGAPGVGARVFHPHHGHGTIHRSGKATVGVTFDNGEKKAFEHARGGTHPRAGQTAEGGHFAARVDRRRKENRTPKTPAPHQSEAFRQHAADVESHPTRATGPAWGQEFTATRTHRLTGARQLAAEHGGALVMAHELERGDRVLVPNPPGDAPGHTEHVVDTIRQGHTPVLAGGGTLPVDQPVVRTGIGRGTAASKPPTGPRRPGEARPGDLAVIEQRHGSLTGGEPRTTVTVHRVTAVERDGTAAQFDASGNGYARNRLHMHPDDKTIIVPAHEINVDAALHTAADNGAPFGSLDETRAALRPHRIEQAPTAEAAKPEPHTPAEHEAAAAHHHAAAEAAQARWRDMLRNPPPDKNDHVAWMQQLGAIDQERVDHLNQARRHQHAAAQTGPTELIPGAVRAGHQGPPTNGAVTDPDVARHVQGMSIMIPRNVRGLRLREDEKAHLPDNASNLRFGSLDPDGTVRDDKGRVVGQAIDAYGEASGAWVPVQTSVPGATHGTYRTVSLYRGKPKPAKPAKASGPTVRDLRPGQWATVTGKDWQGEEYTFTGEITAPLQHDGATSTVHLRSPTGQDIELATDPAAAVHVHTDIEAARAWSKTLSRAAVRDSFAARPPVGPVSKPARPAGLPVSAHPDAAVREGGHPVRDLVDGDYARIEGIDQYGQAASYEGYTGNAMPVTVMMRQPGGKRRKRTPMVSVQVTENPGGWNGWRGQVLVHPHATTSPLKRQPTIEGAAAKIPDAAIYNDAQRLAVERGGAWSGNPHGRIGPVEKLTDDEYRSLTPQHQDRIREGLERLRDRRSETEIQQRAQAQLDRFANLSPDRSPRGQAIDQAAGRVRQARAELDQAYTNRGEQIRTPEIERATAARDSANVAMRQVLAGDTSVEPVLPPKMREHLDSAHAAMQRGDHEMAVNHLTEAAIHAPDGKTRGEITAQRNDLAARLMGKRPEPVTKPQMPGTSRADQVLQARVAEAAEQHAANYARVVGESSVPRYIGEGHLKDVDLNTSAAAARQYLAEHPEVLRYSPQQAAEARQRRIARATEMDQAAGTALQEGRHDDALRHIDEGELASPGHRVHGYGWDSLRQFVEEDRRKRGGASGDAAAVRAERATERVEAGKPTSSLNLTNGVGVAQHEHMPATENTYRQIRPSFPQPIAGDVGDVGNAERVKPLKMKPGMLAHIGGEWHRVGAVVNTRGPNRSGFASHATGQYHIYNHRGERLAEMSPNSSYLVDRSTIRGDHGYAPRMRRRGDNIEFEPSPRARAEMEAGRPETPTAVQHA